MLGLGQTLLLLTKYHFLYGFYTTVSLQVQDLYRYHWVSASFLVFVCSTKQNSIPTPSQFLWLNKDYLHQKTSTTVSRAWNPFKNMCAFSTQMGNRPCVSISSSVSLFSIVMVSNTSSSFLKARRSNQRLRCSLYLPFYVNVTLKYWIFGSWWT